MKLLGSTKNKITNDENAPHLEITEAVLLPSDIVNNDYEHDFKSLVYICS